MKKRIVPILISLVAAMSFVACGKDPEPMREPRYITINSMENRVLIQEVYPNDWTENDGMLYATYEWDGISRDVLRNGTVNVYVYEYDYDVERQVALPHIYPVTFENEDKTEWWVLPEKISYDLDEGHITFIMQELSDETLYADQVGSRLKFRVVAQTPITYELEQ